MELDDSRLTRGDNTTVDTSEFSEHRIERGAHEIYARHYAGTAPAFVLMHGFPDNLRIYDALAPLLAGAGRRVVAFDFLGYGGSDKPVDYRYTSAGLEDDLQAVVVALGLGPVVPVAHDASGPTAINWALAHPQQVGALALLNTYYDAAPTLRFPEFISLFADPGYTDLAAARRRPGPARLAPRLPSSPVPARCTASAAGARTGTGAHHPGPVRRDAQRPPGVYGPHA